MSELKYKLIAFDLDDTILNDEKKIPDTNRAAIERLLELGVKLAISTGRSKLSIDRYIALHKFNYAICMNGAAVYDLSTNGIIYEKQLQRDYAYTIFYESKKFGADIQFFKEQRFIVDSCKESAEAYRKLHNLTYDIVNPEKTDLGDVYKILAVGDNETLSRFKTHMQQMFGEDVNTFFSNPRLLEFVHKDVGKGSALRILARREGFDIAETIAAGDQFNDLSMLEAAGLSVAPQNAVEEIKKRVDYVCKSNNNDGILAEILELYY